MKRALALGAAAIDKLEADHAVETATDELGDAKIEGDEEKIVAATLKMRQTWKALFAKNEAWSKALRGETPQQTNAEK